MTRYIIHISDLNIRENDRHDEYELVFKNTIESIKKIVTQHHMIIITGNTFYDIKHVNINSIRLYKSLLNPLSQLCQVIICDDYDSITNEISPPNVNVLGNDVFIHLGNIHVYNVYERTDHSSNGCTIALLNDNNNIPLDAITNFDFAMIGGVCKRHVSIYNKRLYYGYAGSLIQQGFDEDILDSGYHIWDIESKKVDIITVCNNVGYINIKEGLNDIMMRINNKFNTRLREIVSNVHFPDKLFINLYSNIDIQLLDDILLNKQYKIVSNKFTRSILDDDKLLLNYFSKYLSSDEYNELIELMCDLIHVTELRNMLHHELIKLIHEITLMRKPKFKIRYIEWCNVYGFDDVNWINVRDLMSKTFMINGLISDDKTKIFDIIMLSIWGVSTFGVISRSKNNAYTVIDIEYANVIYRIKRSFTVRHSDGVDIHSHKYIYKISQDVMQLIAKDHDCTIKVLQLFGTPNRFKSTSLINEYSDGVLEYHHTMIMGEFFNAALKYYVNEDSTDNEDYVNVNNVIRIKMLKIVTSNYNAYIDHSYNDMTIRINEIIKSISYSDTPFIVKFIDGKWCVDNNIRLFDFQKFIITLALKIMMYNTMQCDQIFIDGIGMNADNLSFISPSALLNHFDTVIIVSFNDTRKNSIISDISYNTYQNTPRIRYGLQYNYTISRKKITNI